MQPTWLGCLHRPESEPLRHIAPAGLQRLRARAPPARVKGSGGSHGGYNERNLAGMVEYGGSEGVDARQRITQGTRKTVAAYLGEHVGGLLRVATGIITDAKMIEFGFKRVTLSLRRQKRSDGVACRRFQH